MSYQNPTLDELRAEHAKPNWCACTGACGGNPANCDALAPNPPLPEWIARSAEIAEGAFGNTERAANLRARLAELAN